MGLDKPSFYAILPADVRYAEDLTSLQKILYAEITALTNKEWYCYAGNSYFAELYKKDPTRVSKTISDMQKKWYLQVSREKESWFVRRIYVWELKELKKTIKTTCRKVQKASCSWVQEGVAEKCKTPLAENCNIIIQDNNTTRKNNLSPYGDSILADSGQKKTDHKKSSALKKLGAEEKEKSSAKKEKESYGDEEINACIDLIKHYNDGITNWSARKQRQFASHLINKLKKLDYVKQWNFKRYDVLDAILKVISRNEYHSSKIASPELIYYNLASLLQICKNEQRKQNNTSIPSVNRV